MQPLLKLFHEAHPGIAAMQQLVARGLWWSEMMQAIVRHCAIRHACDSLKASRSLQRTPMRAFANAALTAEEVRVDVVGLLPGVEYGHRYLLVLLDHYSRWIHAEPMQGQTSAEILDAFMLYVGRRGSHRVLYSDRQSSMGYLNLEQAWRARHGPTGNCRTG